MNEKVQDFLAISALLIGNNAEHRGKHLQRTAAFSMGTLIPHWMNVSGKDSALRTKKQSAKVKPLNHDGLMEGGTVIMVLWYRE